MGRKSQLTCLNYFSGTFLTNILRLQYSFSKAALSLQFQDGILNPHAASCTCAACCDDMSLVSLHLLIKKKSLKQISNKCHNYEYLKKGRIGMWWAEEFFAQCLERESKKKEGQS